MAGSEKLHVDQPGNNYSSSEPKAESSSASHGVVSPTDNKAAGELAPQEGKVPKIALQKGGKGTGGANQEEESKVAGGSGEQ